MEKYYQVNFWSELLKTIWQFFCYLFVSDYGYKKAKDKCVVEDWFNPDEPPFECPEGTKYNKSSG